jgi:hypothetical protein
MHKRSEIDNLIKKLTTQRVRALGGVVINAFPQQGDLRSYRKRKRVLMVKLCRNDVDERQHR